MRRTMANPESRNTRPTSTILRSTERTAPMTPRYTGKNTPAARWTGPCAPQLPRTRQARPAAASPAQAGSNAPAARSPPAHLRLLRRSPSWRQQTWPAPQMQHRADNAPASPRSRSSSRKRQRGQAETVARRTRKNARLIRDVAIVDEIVDRFLDIHIGADHARFLQRDARFEDR